MPKPTVGEVDERCKAWMGENVNDHKRYEEGLRDLNNLNVKFSRMLGYWTAIITMLAFAASIVGSIVAKKFGG